MRRYPLPIGVCDLVVYPGERASRSPVGDGPGFPAQSEPLVLALVRCGWLGPGHDWQIRQAEAGSYFGVRIVQPGRRPDQGARQPGQARPSVQAKATQVRTIDTPPRPGLRASAEGQQRAVDVEE